jgi:hypothetical protein
MVKKTEVDKLSGWVVKNRGLGEPPSPNERLQNLREVEYAPPPSNEPEEQYNIRLPRSLKRRVKRLVAEEGKPMAVILEKMLELYEQYRARRVQQASALKAPADE